MPRRAMIFLSLLVTGSAFAAPPVPEKIPVEILSAEFGLFDASNPKESAFEPGLRVPHREGQRYGWVITVQTTRRSLSVREEYVLPTASKSKIDAKEMDAVTASLSIATPKRNQISQRQLVPVDGKIYGEWAVGPSEPAGHRHLQVIIEGDLAASFEFDVK